jgi:hypothetical protein
MNFTILSHYVRDINSYKKILKNDPHSNLFFVTIISNTISKKKLCNA